MRDRTLYLTPNGTKYCDDLEREGSENALYVCVVYHIMMVISKEVLQLISSLTHLLTHSLTHSLGMTKRSKFNVLLSCSHIFHEKCINNFERFSVSAAEDATHHVLCCPICRMSNYMKYKFKAWRMGENADESSINYNKNKVWKWRIHHLKLLDRVTENGTLIRVTKA